MKSLIHLVVVAGVAWSAFSGCVSTSDETADESEATGEAARSDEGQYDAGVELDDKATTPDATVRTVVHIIRRFSLTTSGGLVMNNDHVTVSNISSALASANTIWKRPTLQSVTMNATIVEENALSPSNSQQLKAAILATTRDNNQAYKAYPSFFDPSKRSGDNKTLHIYVVPFYGQTLQGVTMLNRREIIVGSWSNKSGGGAPQKRNITEFPSNTCAQSFVRTLAHEFGHGLTLQHSDCNSCIMQDCTDVNPVRSKALSGWSQYWK